MIILQYFMTIPVKGPFFKFQEFSRTKVKFKDFSRSVQTLLDLVNMNAYRKFGKMLSNCCPDIERKWNYDGMTDNPNPV